MVRIFVTGGSGFVGKHLVCRLLREKFIVTCFSKHKAGIKSKARIFFGAIENKIPNEAIRGNDIVIHIAGEVKNPKWNVNYMSNILGTRNVLQACKRNGIKKIIYMSTINTQLKKRRAYGKTKRIAEELVMQSGLDYVIIRPSMIYGKGDHSISKTVELVKKLPFVPILGDGQGVMQPVFIKDVIAIVIKCIKQDTHQRVYTLVSSKSITFDEYINLILKAINLKKRKIHIPLMFTKIIAYFCEKLSGAHPVITLEQVYTINQKEMWGIEREKKELGYNPIDLDVDIIKKIL